jgi:predicted nucleic acid-binding protein
VIVYVESNFVIELALLQEQHAACDSILRICEAGDPRLVMPAFSMMEPLETVRRHQVARRRAKKTLEDEIRQLARTAIYKERLRDVETVVALLVDSSEEDLQRLASVRSRLLACVELIPLESAILTHAEEHQEEYDLSAQDAVVYASVLAHLKRSGEPSCFVSRDRDFDDQEIKRELKSYNCRLLSNFETADQFLRGLYFQGSSQESP